MVTTPEEIEYIRFLRNKKRRVVPLRFRIPDVHPRGRRTTELSAALTAATVAAFTRAADATVGHEARLQRRACAEPNLRIAVSQSAPQSSVNNGTLTRTQVAGVYACIRSSGLRKSRELQLRESWCNSRFFKRRRRVRKT